MYEPLSVDIFSFCVRPTVISLRKSLICLVALETTSIDAEDTTSAT
jgi:hypothetical protein